MKLLKFLDDKLELILINILLINITFWIFYEVVMRYLFNNASSWGEEFVRWCFIWFIWIGVSYGFKTRSHIAVTVFVNLLPMKLQEIINFIVNAFMFWCMIKLTIYGYEQLVSPSILKQTSVVLYWPFSEQRVSMQWLYLSLPFGALLSAIRLAQNIYWDIDVLKSTNYTKDN
ncbi:TRAP transporter small permease [Lonepinella koalarum]|uniref:TRAP transporter small permease n=1 Tax=Lonepinella koalarum TaxID=53417 RepID=UPI003F6DECAB